MQLCLVHCHNIKYICRKYSMKKLLVLLLLFVSFSTYAQWVDVSALYGYAPYKISAGIKNGGSGTYNISASIVKLKFLDAGIQYNGINTVTLCRATSPGVFADLVWQDDDKKDIVSTGGQINYTRFGNIKIPGAYFKYGSDDTVSTKVDNALSYGLRLGYKREVKKHLYVYALISPTYTSSTIHYANISTNNCAVLYVPFMIGISARF